MTNTVQYPSYLDCVADILRQASAPLSVDVLVEQVKSQRPTGKGVRSAVYQALGKLYQAVPVAPGTFGWLSNLLAGQSFRHPLNKIEMQRGNLLMDELEHALFFPEFFQDHQPDGRIVRLHLMGGPTLEVHAAVDQETWALRLGQEFVAWLDQTGGSAYDDLLIRVLDAVSGEYSLRLQPREARQEEEIQERNLQLAHSAEAIVTSDRKSRSAMPVWELAAALVGRSVFADPPRRMICTLPCMSIASCVWRTIWATLKPTGIICAGNARSGATILRAVRAIDRPGVSLVPANGRTAFPVVYWGERQRAALWTTTIRTSGMRWKTM